METWHKHWSVEPIASKQAYTYSRTLLTRTRLSRTPRYLELKPIPLALVFQSFTIGYLEHPLFQTIFVSLGSSSGGSSTVLTSVQ